MNSFLVFFSELHVSLTWTILLWICFVFIRGIFDDIAWWKRPLCVIVTAVAMVGFGLVCVEVYSLFSKDKSVDALGYFRAMGFFFSGAFSILSLWYLLQFTFKDSYDVEEMLNRLS